MPEPFAVEGVLRRYDWGSTTAIPKLLGVPPDGRPAAELWFGAHPDDPCRVLDSDATLAELIDTDPVPLLGGPALARFGPQLPFLMKVLAASTPLSIQVHPSLAEAKAGFAAEEAAGVPRSAPNRNYRDANHKPELLCALDPFDALCGFRPVGQILALLDELKLPELQFVADLLHGPDPLRAAFTALLTHAQPAALVDALTRHAATADDGPLLAVRLAAAQFPGDVGVALTLLLNLVRLEPGQAIYLAAGTVHCHLRGTGVEIMANSDNVLRCGLTPKHVDVPELLKITDFTPLADPLWPAVGGCFDVPVPDFRLVRLQVEEPTGLDDVGPCIVLCTEGRIRVGDVEIGPGHAAFVPAGAATALSGTGLLFVGGVGTL